MQNDFFAVSMLILALALLGVMTLGGLGWKLLRFIQSLLTRVPDPEERPARRVKPAELTEERLELPSETAQSITDRVVRSRMQ